MITIDVIFSPLYSLEPRSCSSSAITERSPILLSPVSVMQRFLTSALLTFFALPLTAAAATHDGSALSIRSVAEARALIRQLRVDFPAVKSDFSIEVETPVAEEEQIAEIETDSFTQKVFELVNAERKKKGLSAYKYNSILESSAEDYAAHMEDEDCFSHTGCGSTLKERMHDSGYYLPKSKRPCKCNQSYYYGENIARGQTTAEKVMKDWLNSPPHKAAILSTKFKEIGIGKSGKYWVQHFGAIK